MRFLANENFPKPSIVILRSAGYEITSIAEKHPGISDQEVVQMARRDNLVILTFDKDYGEIIFKEAQAGPPSVVIFKFKGSDPQFAGTHLVNLLEKKSLSFEKTFTVVEEENIRQRRY